MNNKEHQLREELKKIQDQLQNPAIYTDPSYPKLAKRQKELEEIISLFNQLAKNQQAYEASQKLAQCKDELADLAKAELEDLEKQKGKITNTKLITSCCTKLMWTSIAVVTHNCTTT